MSASEIRIVVEARQPDGSWTQTATVPLDQGQCEIVCGWIFSVPEIAAYGEDLWALPDDALLELLEGKDGEAVGMALVEYLPDFDAAMEQRFGVSVVLEFCARRLSSQGLDGEAFRNLPRDEQLEFINRFVEGAAWPVEH